MIQFPETASTEWKIIADAANAALEVRRRIDRDSRVEVEVERLRVRHEAALLFQQELDADSTPVLEMGTLATYNANPSAAPNDMIDGVMKAEGLCIVMGPSTSGKSTMALQMCHSLMSGEDWLGRPVTQIAGSVGVLSYDMDAALVLDWMSGFPNIDPNKVSVVNAYKRGNPLGVAEFRKQIASTWRAMNVEVVVLDSFSASFFGHDQNDQAATMAHYRDMKLFALTEVGAKALIVIAHSTESSPHKIRGSTVHHDTADTIVAVVANKTGDREVSMVKYRQHRDAATGSMTHQMNPVIVTAPDDVTHLVDVNFGAMALAGLPLPTGAAAAAAFTALPEPTQAPDTDSDEEDDDL